MGQYFIFILVILASCAKNPVKKNMDSSSAKELEYIRAIAGDDEEINLEVVKRGEVLISYSDCSACHKIDKRAKGPAFQDIAKRYPFKEVYISLLARKVISGGTGSWGNPVMPPHASITEKDAYAMVSYILSLQQQH